MNLLCKEIGFINRTNSFISGIWGKKMVRFFSSIIGLLALHAWENSILGYRKSFWQWKEKARLFFLDNNKDSNASCGKKRLLYYVSLGVINGSYLYERSAWWWSISFAQTYINDKKYERLLHFLLFSRIRKEGIVIVEKFDI